MKNWDSCVSEAEAVARTPGFRHLRDRILNLAAPRDGEVAVDVGAGTGLLALALAPRVGEVWALDASARMCDYLRAKAASGRMENVRVVHGSAVSLPLVDDFADVVVSNYCLHHLRDEDKRRALAEAARVLRPGGRLVFGDMMFRVTLRGARERRLLREKARAIACRGPAGLARLGRNAVRLAAGRWEHPADADWWTAALDDAGLVDVRVQMLPHEGGIAAARLPAVPA